MGLKKQAVEDLSNLVDLNDNEKESINVIVKVRLCLSVVIDVCV